MNKLEEMKIQFKLEAANPITILAQSNKMLFLFNLLQGFFSVLLITIQLKDLKYQFQTEVLTGDTKILKR